jgi:aspartyl-tRNA(Asn)/glutamyl-tRNA(Gln) amidotransferase subunit A
MAETLLALAAALADGETTSAALVARSLERIADKNGEGARAFLAVRADQAREEAAFWDGQRKAGRALPRFAGIPFSVKDLFDLAGETTRAASKLLADAPPAKEDAAAIARLRAAGFVAIGRTNMTEFAYSGVGLNPHYGTPRSAYDRKTGRAPGGSTSGGAVSVADGMAPLAIGSDTGGSCRIPAAYNGIVGYKPSMQRVSKRGAYPLSESFDSVGPLANSVACCAAADAIMAGDWHGHVAQKPLKHMRFAVLRNFALDGLDPEVASDYSRALSSIDAALSDISFKSLEELSTLNRNGGIVAAEAWAVHGAQIEMQESHYDPRVSARMRTGAKTTVGDYLAIKRRRAEMIVEFAALMSGFDAMILPTVMNIPPRLDAFAQDEDYIRLNSKSLRNTYIGNFLDGCSISLPMHRPGAAPTGLMLIAPNGRDQALFAAAAALEPALSSMNS